ncbi:hypothetical protein [Microbacterium halotolerans]|uniref:hypothetical protein n=1 Tax=Microbacterium halotolerans TaxID=246613 RepID=UPI0013C31BE5|nr:hypothetical protein [Microbacterium halotolerans]
MREPTGVAPEDDHGRSAPDVPSGGRPDGWAAETAGTDGARTAGHEAPAPPVGTETRAVPPAPGLPAGYGLPEAHPAPGYDGQGGQPGWAGSPRQPQPSPLAAKEPWVAALVHSSLGLAGAAAASVVIVVLGVIGVQFTGDDDIAAAVASQWFPMIVQFLGAGFLGSFGTTVSAMGFTVSASLFFVPFVVPVCAVLAVLLFGRRAAGTLHVSTLWRAVTATIAGAGFAMVVLVLQLAAPISVVVPEAPGVSIRAISAWSILLGIVIVAAATFVSLSPRGATRSRWRSGALQAIEHLGGFGAVLAVAVLVVAMIDSGGEAGGLLLFAPALLPLLAADATALGAFSTVFATAQGDIDSYLPVDVPSASLTVFSDVLPLGLRIAVPVLALVAIAVASVRWRVRRGAATDPVNWFVLPAGYAAFGIVVMIAGRISGSGSIGSDGAGLAGLFGGGGMAGMSFGIAPAAWTFVLFAVFGVAVEALARLVVPRAARSMPLGLLKALTFGATAAPATGHAPAAQAPAWHQFAQGGRPAQGTVPPPPGEVPPPPLGVNVPPRPPAPGEAVPAGGAGAGAEPMQSPVGASPAAAPTSAQTQETDDPFHDLLSGDESQREPLGRGAKTAWLVGGLSVLGIVVLIVAGLLVRGYFAGTQYSPQAKVENYLQAIVDGNASDALELWEPNVTSAERVLLTDEVYAAAENRPTAFEIGTVTEIDGGASIAATLTVDSKRYDVSFELEKAGSAAVVFDDWKIVSGPEQTVRIGDVSQVVQVNGVGVDLSEIAVTEFADENDHQWSELTDIPVLPGDYTFTAPEADGLFTYGDDQVATALPNADFQTGWEQLEAPQFASFTVKWTDDAQQQAIDQVQARIDECMKSDQFVPKLCQNSLVMNDPSFMAITSITRSWEQEPTLTFENLEGRPVVAVEGGELRIDYKERYSEDDAWEPDYDTSSSPFGWSGLEVPVSANDDGEVEVDLSVF